VRSWLNRISSGSSSTIYIEGNKPAVRVSSETLKYTNLKSRDLTSKVLTVADAEMQMKCIFIWRMEYKSKKERMAYGIQI
jgi:hypothetical protein